MPVSKSPLLVLGGTVNMVEVLVEEQSMFPIVATNLTFPAGPLTTSTLTALPAAPMAAQLPVQRTYWGTPTFQTVPSVGSL